ncbi:MAG: hypothetical protein OHK93_003039 [Ramalina farinacea]|uniref:Heterokaryon incompatibility domain-containing protein n=1 Tax=Ramalina farinacea TaxID=258253 RepID=A0AA43QVU7_9LECA|nr:hypothetical protein [Ramalina farinacea]
MWHLRTMECPNINLIQKKKYPDSKFRDLADQFKMRLLDTSNIQLREFIGDEVPPYAILSHTWGKEEVSYQGLSGARSTKGFQKILRCCTLAKSEGYDYVWIDTCCIDKTSSAELSEGINSMYRWYANAAICYAYLADVSLWPDIPNTKSFEESRWFSRGWTLQELLAPQTVIFYDHDWNRLGTRASREA